MVKDMTKGSPMKLILGFAIPMLMGMLFQQFYNLVDTMIVGKTLGVDALAGVGATACINFMIIGFCMGVCNGFAIPVAQQFGAGKYSELRKYVYNGYICSIIFSVVLTVASVVGCRGILTLLRTPSNIYEHAYAYIVVIFAGIPTVFLYNMVSGILRSLGDSVTPVVCLIASSLLNIVLDILLVRPMGVAGAAVATVVAQAISGVGCLIYMCKKLGYLHFTKQDWAFSMRHCLTLCGMGVPMGLQYSITAIGSVILQAAVNSMGESVIAAVSAGTKISMFLCCPFDAMGSTMATYGGQNVGAKKMDRVDAGLKACIKLGIAYAILAFVFILLFGKNLALLFLDAEETEIIKLVYYFLLGNSGAYILLALVNIVRFMIQGLGYSAFAVIAGICEMVARTIAGFILVPKFGYVFVALGSPLAWIFADIFLIPAYIYVVKRLRRKFGQETPAMLKRCQKNLA